MKNPVFCALIEIQPLKDCELDPKEIAGAVVRCYIPAKDAKTAKKELQGELKVMKMNLVEVDWCVDYDQTEWENPNEIDEDDFVKEARETKTVIFGTFHTWTHAAPEEE